jgi:hypothetical protein
MLSAIETQLIAHILTTLIETCVFGFPGNVTRYPAASCGWRGGSVDKVAGNGTIRDLALTLEVLIEGTDADSVQLAAEEVSALWYDAARFAQLSALGVVGILPGRLQPPLSHGDTAQLAKAQVAFEVVVRMT